MPALTPTLRDRLRAPLADLKMPGALEALGEILRPRGRPTPSVQFWSAQVCSSDRR